MPRVPMYARRSKAVTEAALTPILRRCSFMSVLPKPSGSESAKTPGSPMNTFAPKSLNTYGPAPFASGIFSGAMSSPLERNSGAYSKAKYPAE